MAHNLKTLTFLSVFVCLLPAVGHLKSRKEIVCQQHSFSFFFRAIVKAVLKSNQTILPRLAAQKCCLKVDDRNGIEVREREQELLNSIKMLAAEVV